MSKAKDENGKKLILTRKAVIISALAFAVLAVIIILTVNCGIRNPEEVVKSFYSSLLPDCNTESLRRCLGDEVFNERFNDEGYFFDRLKLK